MGVSAIFHLNHELPDPVRTAIEALHTSAVAYVHGLWFVVNDTGRDPTYFERHLLSYVAQDFLQSALAIPVLAREGILSTARRELRFILEASIKLCYVQQREYPLPIDEKLQEFERELDSPKISLKERLNLHMLPESERGPFGDEVGRLYGGTSDYVHLTSTQILDRIRAVDAGRTAGKESAGDVESLNALVLRALAASLVYLLHAVPDSVAGDLLVEADGSSHDWLFGRSRWISLVDAHFDYKAERQARLADVRSARAASVQF